MYAIYALGEGAQAEMGWDGMGGEGAGWGQSPWEAGGSRAGS
jgi:hypothetical protein